MAKKKQIEVQRPDGTAFTTTLDLTQLTVAECERIKHAIDREVNRRDTVFSLRLKRRDIETWKTRAKAKDESLTDWVERSLNKTAAEEA